MLNEITFSFHGITCDRPPQYWDLPAEPGSWVVRCVHHYGPLKGYTTCGDGETPRQALKNPLKIDNTIQI